MSAPRRPLRLAAHPPQVKQADADGMIPVTSEYSALPEVVMPPEHANLHRPTYHTTPQQLHPSPYQHTPAVSPLTPYAPGASPFFAHQHHQPSPFTPFADPARPGTAYGGPPPAYDSPPPVPGLHHALGAPPHAYDSTPHAYDGPLPGGAGPGYGPPLPSGGLGPMAAARRRRRRRTWLILLAVAVVIIIGSCLAAAFALGWIHPKTRSTDGRVAASRRALDVGWGRRGIGLGTGAEAVEGTKRWKGCPDCM